MVASKSKKKTKKKSSPKKKTKSSSKKTKKKSSHENRSKKTLSLANEQEIAMDFATKAYKTFDSLIKSIVLFGSSAKQEVNADSDIDIIIIVDDVSVKFDEELVSWYRKHLGVLVNENKYIRSLHINTVKLSTWYQDVFRGDPIAVNVLRYGHSLIDIGGFFNPLKVLLKEGKIKSTPEAIYTLLERAPTHLARARNASLAVVDGLYWCMVDAAHSALISADIVPPSPEKIAEYLNEHFVKNKLLHKKYVDSYAEIHAVAKEIVHGKRSEISGKTTDEWFVKSEDFLKEMAKLVEDIVRNKK